VGVAGVGWGGLCHAPNRLYLTEIIPRENIPEMRFPLSFKTKLRARGWLMRYAGLIGSLVVAISLLGCSSPEKRAARERERQAQSLAAEERWRLSLGQKCEYYGFESGTPAFASCLMQVDQISRQLQAAAEARAAQEASCRRVMGRQFSAPTQSGNFWESFGAATSAYQNCLAGLPYRPPMSIFCTRQGKDHVSCFVQ
jgi:hypothetical protein